MTCSAVSVDTGKADAEIVLVQPMYKAGAFLIGAFVAVVAAYTVGGHILSTGSPWLLALGSDCVASSAKSHASNTATHCGNALIRNSLSATPWTATG